ncbi:hypothetical protein DSM106972_044250 [Dulcicalothrix desertica PCC 7102]|uniref:histidine kinase n=1 Tax=Dulcicalothrix desertica PCC 7102 TaxID=232991 RepID=A0A3S1B4Z3_9CYAN|nr:response regulator [Dulcicalothrix desertica]RUT04855.1 hypothetical protein DSM106972_044250 [Dulcicalothrix desertica PCC 7102]TWH42867.1 PAS domain S-box-containing protein [Dulcicalothrix desertica PCC 7102]
MTKILIVEDNEVNRDMLSRRLIRHDYEIIFALNGVEGVSKTLAEKPDLILMDMNLPVIDGWEATRQLKANSQTRNIPVIALTAHSMQGDREKALAAGCDEYESKPIDFSRLLSKIESFIEKTKSSSDLNISQLNPYIQKALFSNLRHELCTPINAIIGYSEILLDGLKHQQNTNIYIDISKIFTSGHQMLTLANKLIDPAYFELNKEHTFDDFGAKIRLEILTPLSTIIGYCELLVEEPGADFAPDLERINTSAQKVLNMVNNIVNLAQQQLQAIDIEVMQTAASKKHFGQQLIADAAPIAIIISRLSDGLIVYANAAAALTFVLPVAQLCNRHIQDFLGHTDYDQITSALQKNETIVNRELRTISASGTQLWMTASLQPLTFNSEPTILSVLCDITDRKRAEDALRIDAESYKSIFENALQGIYQATPDGQIVFVNQSMAMIHGFDNPITMIETVNTINYKLYVDNEWRSSFRYLLEAQGQVIGIEYQVYKYSGEIIWIAESARAVRDANGKAIYYEGILEDITQRKIKELALQREIEKLQTEINQTRNTQQVTEVGNARTILLVEDNEMNRDMLSRRLKRSGYKVIIAVDGSEGVSLATTAKPNIILMDMSLPVLDGWEATKQLKANNNTKHIPIIALTAHAMSGDREKALNSGCDEYDTKPIEMPRLLDKITTLLNK